MPRVLILCTGNSCRSVMAEAIWRSMAGARGWECYSAGTLPTGGIHSLAIQALTEIGVPIQDLRSKSIKEFAGQKFDLVVTVCDRAKAECPAFPGARETLHWPFEDPAQATGSNEERMPHFQRVRDEIRAAIRGYLRTPAVRFRLWMQQVLEQAPRRPAAAEAERCDTVVRECAALLGERHRLFGELPRIIAQHFQERGFAWNGFYTLYGEQLRLTSAAGPPVCASIDRKGGVGSSGMCFDGIDMNQTLVASDVSRWPGYIRCDAESGIATVAGMVCPIRGRDGLPIAVWDVDSTKPIGEQDAYFLDRLFASLSALMHPTRADLEGRARELSRRDRRAEGRPQGRLPGRGPSRAPSRAPNRSSGRGFGGTMRPEAPRRAESATVQAADGAAGDAESPESHEWGDAIKLDQFLKLQGLVDTGGRAKIAVQAGEVKVNGEVERRRGRRLKDGDVIEYLGKSITVEPAQG